MVKFNKSSISLVIALILPLIMIVAVVVAIYVPKLFVEPAQYDFLYSTGEPKPFGLVEYVVRDGRLVKEEIPRELFDELGPTRPLIPYAGDLRFFRHDVKTNTSQELSFEEAQKLRLNPYNKSPDGYSLVQGNRLNGFFPFFSETDYNSWYLKGHNVSYPMYLQQIGQYGSMTFLGWIEEEHG